MDPREIVALLAVALQVAGGDDADWDAWARTWTLKDRAGVRHWHARTRGFREGVELALGVTDHDHAEGATPRLLRRAYAREAVTRAASLAGTRSDRVEGAFGEARRALVHARRP